MPASDHVAPARDYYLVILFPEKINMQKYTYIYNGIVNNSWNNQVSYGAYYYD